MEMAVEIVVKFLGNNNSSDHVFSLAEGFPHSILQYLAQPPVVFFGVMMNVEDVFRCRSKFA